MVVCLNPTSGKKTVLHHYTSDFNSNLLDPAKPRVGLSRMRLSNSGPNMTCSFRRQNAIAAYSNYFNLDTNYSPIVIAAYGPLDDSSNLMMHTRRKKKGPINFSQWQATTAASNRTSKSKSKFSFIFWNAFTA